MMREAAGTRRFHTCQTIGYQTVAEHSYHVAMLCIELSDGKPSAELLKAALYHDLPETVTGDVPSPAKWLSNDLCAALKYMEVSYMVENGLVTNLTPREELILQYADAFELAFYCTDQLMLGNKYMNQIYHKISNYIGNLPVLIKAELMMDRLQEKYHDATV
jgi:5'-deoxynucleotidase YfbR-like HD superfamily hydrolase